MLKKLLSKVTKSLKGNPVLTSSRASHFFIYPKDAKRKFTGHTYCVLLHNNKMFHGEALCSDKDQFNKEVGRKLAYERALAAALKNDEYEQTKDL